MVTEGWVVILFWLHGDKEQGIICLEKFATTKVPTMLVEFFTPRKCPRRSSFHHLSYWCLKNDERNLNMPFIKTKPEDLTCLLWSLKYCLSLTISVCIYCFRILYRHLQMPGIFRHVSFIAEFLVGREIRERLNGNWLFLFFTHSSETQLRPCLKGKCSTCLSCNEIIAYLSVHPSVFLHSKMAFKNVKIFVSSLSARRRAEFGDYCP